MYYAGQLPGRFGTAFEFTKRPNYAIMVHRCPSVSVLRHRESHTKGAEGGNGKGKRERPFALSIVSLHTNQ
jgi:hypothetical protein